MIADETKRQVTAFVEASRALAHLGTTTPENALETLNTVVAVCNARGITNVPLATWDTAIQTADALFKALKAAGDKLCDALEAAQ